MRLPGSAGLLSLLGAAGPGTTFWALCFMVLPDLVILFSTTLWVTVTRWNWLPCSGPLFGWRFLAHLAVCIATDSWFSSNVAEALWSVGGHARLTCLCSSLLLIARQIVDVRFEQLIAHEGNPFKELADGLAKRAAGGVFAPLPDDVSRLLVCGDSVTWERLHGMPPETRGAYPSVCDGSFVFPETRSSVVPGSLVKHVANDVVKGQRSTDVFACVHVGSLNVCTLGDSGSRSRFLAGRPALIWRQVRELGINLLGVQEARTAAGARVVDGYVVLASGADRGTLGYELWADTGMPYASVDGKDYFFRRADFVAIHASPRVLVVRVTSRCLQCTVVVVAHVPHSGVDVADRNLWWEDLSLRLAGQPDVVLLVDANARLGSAVSAAVGSGGMYQQEGTSGIMFHRTLVELGLCVPATFGPLDDSAFTWVANGGARHRIDYVAVPVPGTWDSGARECSCA